MKNARRFGTGLLLTAALWAGQAGAQGKVVEMVDNHAILNLPVDGFEALPAKDKLLAYHLYQASVAGRDIAFDQQHRHHLAIRELCEQILLHGAGIPKEVLEDIAHYLKLQYINVGIYGKMTYSKFLPPKRLTYAKFSAAVRKAAANGAKFTHQGAVISEPYLDALRPFIFNPKLETFTTTRSPGPGEDMLSGSANNFYERGLKMSDFTGFKDRYPLNSRVVREKGKLTEQVWRVGGMYSPQISKIVGHLKEAVKYADGKNAESLRHLIDYYTTGDPASFTKYNISWLGYRPPVVDIINGFIEEYRDPREKKGTWEGMVFFVNPSGSAWLHQVADKADYYEKQTPFAEEYKRKGVKPVANMVEVLIETGDAGPISWSGVNLPNDQAIRQKYGSKNVLLWNARRAREEVGGGKMIHEFVLPEDRAIIEKYRRSIPEILVGFHETLGHASGKKSSKLKDDPSHYLPGYYSWLEEERADLLALHHAWDPETFRIRKDWTEEAARAFYKYYPVLELINLAELPEHAEAMEEPHQVGGHFAVSYFMKKWNVVEEVRRKVGNAYKTFWVVRDENIPKMRQAVAELLRELQRIKAEGDLAAIEKLAKEYGATKFNKNLAKEIRGRKKALKIPSYYALIFPELTLVQSGKTADVKISYPGDFLRQQMKWSGYSEAEMKKLPGWL